MKGGQDSGTGGEKKAETGLTPTAITPGRRAPSANPGRHHLCLMAPTRGKGHDKF